LAWHFERSSGVSVNGTESLPVPPYVSYKTFRNFLDDLREGIPGRIDRSVVSSLSGTVQGHLLAALRYFSLIDDDGQVHESLARLVNSEGAERKNLIEALLRSGYPPLFNADGFDLSNATHLQFTEKFKTFGASGDTNRKCAAFFLAAAQDAGIPISPRILNATRRRTEPSKNQPARARRTSTRTRAQQPPTKPERSPASSPPESGNLSWEQMLLAKFPSFDPAWPDEVKTKWFDAFDRLMVMGGMPSTGIPTEEVDP